MLREPDCILNITELSKDKFHSLAQDAYSVVGHRATANILGLEFNRESIKINPDDEVLVAQLWGGRLPENCRELPKNVDMKFFCVRVIKK